jgi:hypothetical protein
LPQPFGVKAFGGQPRSCVSDLNAPSHLQLISPERHSADRNPARKCLLGSAHAGMRHSADRAIEQWPVRDELFDPSVGGNAELSYITGWQRGHDCDGLVRQRLQRSFDKAPIVLKFG